MGQEVRRQTGVQTEALRLTSDVTPPTLAEDVLCPRPGREAGGAAGTTPKDTL